MKAPDAALVARARSGDMEAFGELFQITHRRLYNYIRQMVASPEDASDLTQEAYVRVWKGLKSLKADEAFLVWLHRIARNMVLDSRKRPEIPIVSLDIQAGDENSSGPPDIPDWSKDPERIALSEATQESVRKAIRSLPEIHRSVITMHHLEGIGIAEIAKVLEISPGTVLSRLARAREALRRKLGPLIEK